MCVSLSSDQFNVKIKDQLYVGVHSLILFYNYVEIWKEIGKSSHGSILKSFAPLHLCDI